MGFKRKIMSELLRWKNSKIAGKNHEALIIKGLRQVGKTYIAKQFGEENYENIVYMNFKMQPEIKNAFLEDLRVDSIMTALSLYLPPFHLVPGKTLLIMDEIQECPNARSSLRSFVLDQRYDVLATGSLLGIKGYNRTPGQGPSVGQESILTMTSMDFEEFLWAKGVNETILNLLQKSYENRTSIPLAIHTALLGYYREYLVVGGMPEAVQIYVNTHDIARVILFQKEIITQYSHDVSQYVESNSDKQKIKAIYEAIPSQLNDKNRRFYVNALDKYAKLNRYENSFKWLSDAGVALPCYNVTVPQSPLKLNEKHSLFKLFMGDIGLLCASCMENVQFSILNGDLEINMGSILENAMAQQLQSNGFELYYYDSSKLGEVDFVVQSGTGVELLEIKSGKDYRKHKALNNVLSVSEWKFRKATVLCKDNIQAESDIIYLPWYMIMFIKPSQLPKEMIYEVDLDSLYL